MGPRKRLQTGLALTSCASRGLAAALTAGEIGQDAGDGAEAADRSGTRLGQRAGRAPENAGHLRTAFASGRSDSKAGTESLALLSKRRPLAILKARGNSNSYSRAGVHNSQSLVRGIVVDGCTLSRGETYVMVP